MDEPPKNPDTGKRGGLVIGALVGAACFGLIMALRPEFEPIWVRALIAGLAFALLGLVIYQFRGKS